MQLFIENEPNANRSGEKVSSVLPTGLVCQETLGILNSLGKGSIDEKLKRILTEKREQSEQITKLKSELDEEKTRARLIERQAPKQNDSTSTINGSLDAEQQKQMSKEVSDLKNRLQRFEADNVSLQQEVRKTTTTTRERDRQERSLGVSLH